MANKEYYIKYLTNGPVAIETHYIGEQDRRRPLTTVGRLVAAYRHNSLLATTPLELLTLHSISNGVEINYNSWDPLTVLGENGRLGTKPLIIKSKNDMEIGTFN